jgi:hypothetical protein
MNLNNCCACHHFVNSQDAQFDPVSQNVQILKTQVIARAMNH